MKRHSLKPVSKGFFESEEHYIKRAEEHIFVKNLVLVGAFSSQTEHLNPEQNEKLSEKTLELSLNGAKLTKNTKIELRAKLIKAGLALRECW